MEKKDILYFKIIAFIICFIVVVGSMMYLTKDYKTHDQKLKEQSDELRQAKEDMEKDVQKKIDESKNK